MFIIILRIIDKAKAPALLAGHNAWISRGFDDGIFLLVGSLAAGAGGTILAHGATIEEIDARVQADPFVAEGVVRAEILSLSPGRTDERLAFLKD